MRRAQFYKGMTAVDPKQTLGWMYTQRRQLPETNAYLQEMAAMSDSFQSSWKRFAIEGLVIVVSILLAFGIDAFWQERQDRIRTESHLNSLLEEIGEALTAVENSQARRDRRIGVIRELLASITTPEARNTENLNYQLGALWGASRSASGLATLDQMRSTGTLALIESEELRKALINYERYNSNYLHVENRVISAWEEEMRPILAI